MRQDNTKRTLFIGGIGSPETDGRFDSA